MEFNRPKSQTLFSYLREFIFPYAGQTFKVMRVSPPEASSVAWDRNVTDPFVIEELEKLSSPKFNRAFPHYNILFTKRAKKFFLVEPAKIDSQIYPNTFACKNCRRLQIISKRERDSLRGKPKCKECGSPLAQFTLLLVCRKCGEIQEVPTTCPFCKGNLRYVTRARGAIEFECANEACKANKLIRKFDFLVNITKGCRDECNNSFKRGLEGPLIQKPATSKIFKPYMGKILQFQSNEEIPISLSVDELQTFGFENIIPGDLTIYQFALGYRRIAKFEDQPRKRSEDYVYPFSAEGKLVVYGNAIITAGVEFKLDRSILEKTLEEFLANPENKEKPGFKYMIDIVKKEWDFYDKKYDNELIEKESAQRLLLHSFEHALIVLAPTFCGLDYGEIGGFYKSDGMMGKGLEKTNSPCIYIYDNTRYGSGVTFALISNQVFKYWLNKAREIVQCKRNKCTKGACKSCIFLPHTSCFIDINRGLDRELVLSYLTEAAKQFLSL